MTPSRRIGLVEDHESVALGLASMLAGESDLELVITAGTASELLSAAPELDLVILDLRLADGSTPQSNVQALRDRGVEVLVFTGADNPFLVRSAARAGVLGVVRKSEDVQTVIAAVRAA